MKNTLKTITMAAMVTMLTASTNVSNAQTSGTTGRWDLRGNSNIDPTLNFLGTTTNHSLNFKTNNNLGMSLSTSGKLTIGTGTGVFKLEVKGGSINTDSLYRISGVQVIARDASDRVQVGDLNAKVGIGTLAAKSKFQIVNHNGTGLTPISGCNLSIDDTVSHYIQMTTKDGSSTGILFGTPFASFGGGIVYSNKGLQFRTYGNSIKMTIDSLGNAGIGTQTPGARLQVSGGSDVTPSGGGFIVSGSLTGANIAMDDNEIMARTNGVVSSLYFNHSGGNVIIADAGTGNVGIGVTSPTNKLEVCGTIRAKEIKVETGWCDFVFANDYKLRPLSEVESFINENKHLPDVTAGPVIESEGLELGKVSSQMIRKIEELTLYIIELQKQVDQLKSTK